MSETKNQVLCFQCHRVKSILDFPQALSITEKLMCLQCMTTLFIDKGFQLHETDTANVNQLLEKHVKEAQIRNEFAVDFYRVMMPFHIFEAVNCGLIENTNRLIKVSGLGGVEFVKVDKCRTKTFLRQTFVCSGSPILKDKRDRKTCLGFLIVLVDFSLPYFTITHKHNYHKHTTKMKNIQKNSIENPQRITLKKFTKGVCYRFRSFLALFDEDQAIKDLFKNLSYEGQEKFMNLCLKKLHGEAYIQYESPEIENKVFKNMSNYQIHSLVYNTNIKKPGRKDSTDKERPYHLLCNKANFIAGIMNSYAYSE